MPHGSSIRLNAVEDCLGLDLNAKALQFRLHMFLDKDRPDRFEVLLRGCRMRVFVLGPQGAVVDKELVYQAAHMVAAEIEV
jgi:hypothetical protein